MNQVRAEQSRISKVLEGIRMFFEALRVNEGAYSDENEDLKAINKISEKRIREIEDEHTKALESIIPIGNKKYQEGLKKDVHVSESEAAKKAEKVKDTAEQQKDNQKEL